MSIFRQASSIPTVVSSVANIGIYDYSPVAGYLPLNGPMASSLTGQVSFINLGYASGISITSGHDLSRVEFAIIGTYNVTTITENTVGPNNNTVYTNNLFHTIICISINVDIQLDEAFTIGSNYNVAVVLPDGNSKMGESHPNYTYSILLNSLTTAGQWAAEEAIIYGVAGSVPVSLQATSLTYATRPSNYFSLPVTGAAPTAITQAQLNNGIITQTTYPYVAVIVYLAAGINTTPVFIEITQS